MLFFVVCIELLLFTRKCNSPTMRTVLDALSCPLTLSALHVYRALSSLSASSIANEPSVWTVYLPFSRSIRPSFVHVIFGLGTPLVGHLIVIFVLVSAVRSSPIVNVMGLRFWASMVDGCSGMLICGLEGSVKWSKPTCDQQRYVYKLPSNLKRHLSH